MINKKWVTRAVAMVAAAMLLGTQVSVPVHAEDGTGDQAEQPKSKNKIEISVPGDKVPTFEYQKTQDFVIEIKNKEADKVITNFVIEPDQKGEDNESWPFKTSRQKYNGKIDRLGPGESKQIKFSFTEKDDSVSARYTLHFNYEYTLEGEEDERDGSALFYIFTKKKPEDKSKAKKSRKSSGGGGFSNDDFSGGGGGESGGGDGSVPRVIVTGFDTNPKDVKAGTDFTLTIHLKNTSKKQRVKNMLFDLNAPEEGAEEGTSAPSFLPTSGSSTVYLEGIKANGTADISMKLNAKADLVQKPYSVDLSMKYEDADSAAVEANSSLSIPVKQDARYEFSDFEISPESVAVGNEANVMCSLYNLGRIKLYNVKAIFEGDCIEREEVFVGNVDSGATASIDAMLQGTQATEGSGAVTMTLSYEDEEGEVTTDVQELSLEVTEESADAMEPEMTEEESRSRLPILPIVIGALLIVAGIVTAVVLKWRKKKKSMNEEEDLLDELDRTSEDEWK